MENNHVDIEKCLDCEFASSGGDPEYDDTYIRCTKLDEIVYYSYGPIYEDCVCPKRGDLE